MAKQPKRSKTKKPAQAAEQPRPAEAETRENILRIRLTGTERKTLDDAASGESLDTSSWARSVLMKEARRLQSGEDK